MTPRLTAGPPRKLLLATDLSARSDRALDRATQLANHWNAELVVVHALEEQLDSDVVLSWHRRADGGALAEARARQEIQATNPTARVAVEAGKPEEVILRTAEAEACDLIVVGIARDELLGRVLLGNTVDCLLQRSRTPVLVVRQRPRRPYGSIVIATDFSEPSGQALEMATSLFPTASIKLFHAYRPPMAGLVSDPAAYREEFRESLSKEAQEFLAEHKVSGATNVPTEVMLEYGDPERVLRDYVEEKSIDLVVAGTHGRSAVIDVLIGSVAKKLVTTLPCDALLVRSVSGPVPGA